jgi:hypothetical protein
VCFGDRLVHTSGEAKIVGINDEATHAVSLSVE